MTGGKGAEKREERGKEKMRKRSERKIGKAVMILCSPTNTSGVIFGENKCKRTEWGSGIGGANIFKSCLGFK